MTNLAYTSEENIHMVHRDFMAPSIAEAALMTGTATPRLCNHSNPLGVCMLCSIDELEAKVVV